MQAEIQAVFLDEPMVELARISNKKKTCYVISEVWLPFFHIPGDKRHQRSTFKKLVRNHGSGSAEEVPAVDVFGAEVWNKRRIHRPLHEMDCDPEEVTTFIMPAMEMALLYLSHQKGNYQPRALISILRLCSRLPFPLSLPDPAANAELQQRATAVLRNGTPAFTCTSGKNRQRWTLWTNEAYFSSTDINDDHNGGRRDYLAALNMVEVDVMTSVKDASALFDDLKRLLAKFTKAGFRTREETARAKQVKGSGRQRRIWHFKHIEDRHAMTSHHFMELVEDGCYDETSTRWLLEVFKKIRHCNGFNTPHPPATPPRSRPTSPLQQRSTSPQANSTPSPQQQESANSLQPQESAKSTQQQRSTSPVVIHDLSTDSDFVPEPYLTKKRRRRLANGRPAKRPRPERLLVIDDNLHCDVRMMGNT
jgi:hypothetical protein